MEIFVGWIVFSVLVGILAGQRGRSGIGWGFLAAAISPLLAGIILFVIPNLKEKEEEEYRLMIEKKKIAEMQRKEEEERNKADLIITSSEFLLSIDKLHQLYSKQILSDIEYKARKLKMIEELSKRIINDRPEKFLGDLIPLMDANLLSRDEMQKIKSIVLK